jgi:hypothetical protein
MKRIGPSPACADKPRPVTAIAGELAPLASDETPFQTNANQTAIVRYAIENAELIGGRIVTCGKMTA